MHVLEDIEQLGLGTTRSNIVRVGMRVNNSVDPKNGQLQNILKGNKAQYLLVAQATGRKIRTLGQEKDILVARPVDDSFKSGPQSR